MVAVAAAESIESQLKAAALNSDGFTVQYRIGHFQSAGRQNPLKGSAGYIHLLGALLSFQALDVLEANGFSLFHRKSYLFQIPQRYAGWFVIGHIWQRGDPSTFKRSGHA